MLTNTIFFEVPSLTEYSKLLDSQLLIKGSFHGADRRFFNEYLQKFIVYNKDLFDFLLIRPWITGSGKNASIGFSSDRYIGAIPLRSPVNGIQIGDFIVKPRFTSINDDLFSYGKLITLLESMITPDFRDSLPLKSGNAIRPPLYIQSSRFIQTFFSALRSHEWLKFQNRLNMSTEPKSEINWKKYIDKESDPNLKLIFPCRENFLSQYHKEFFEIVFSYFLARNEIVKPETPIQIQIQLEQQIRSLDLKLAGYPKIETNHIQIHQFDFPIIKLLKEQANALLVGNSKEITAWRIDLAILFEKYVQYIFSLVCQETQIKQINNHHILRTGSNLPDWSLKHLEPDLILINDRYTIVVDAKYKSHFYNMRQNTEFLSDEHREDLHQILAYGSFINTREKILILCYPYSRFDLRYMNYGSYLLGTRARIILMGIPIDVSEVNNTKDNILKLVINKILYTASEFV